MGQSIQGLYQSPKQIDSAQKARIKELETENKQLLSLLREIYNKEYRVDLELAHRLGKALNNK